MKVLQVACGISYSKVYYNLFMQLKESEVSFNVYVPQHRNKMIKKLNKSDFPFEFYENVIIAPYHKFFYFSKIKKMIRDIEENIELSETTLIHSHSLFSDGAVAYEIFKKYGIPYIVAVRNTDVNKYFKYAIHLRKYAMDIMNNAKKVIYISPSYQTFVTERYVSKENKDCFFEKSEIIPNGIEDFWFDIRGSKKKNKDDNIRLIFLGRIDKNKNLEAVLKAAIILKTNRKECSVDIIGDGELRKKLEVKYGDIRGIKFHGAVYEKDRVKEMINSSDILVVPSFNETFGLVYVEAMSCGVPVIYTRNEGFDGFFESGKVGFPINPNDPKEISDAVEKIIANYDNVSMNCYDNARRFKWKDVSAKYKKIYLEYSKNY